MRHISQGYSTESHFGCFGEREVFREILVHGSPSNHLYLIQRTNRDERTTGGEEDEPTLHLLPREEGKEADLL